MVLYERRVISQPPANADAKPLAKRHAHDRDRLITFREEDHAYFVYDFPSHTYLRVPRSVSDIHQAVSTPIDSARLSELVVKKRRFDLASPYYWLLQSQADLSDDAGAARVIRAAWDQNVQRSSQLGTACHAIAEEYLNGLGAREMGEYQPLVDATVAWIEGVQQKGWTPFRTEYSIFMDAGVAGEPYDRPLLQAHGDLLAGQIDALFRDSHGDMHMVDWKFCKAERLDPKDGMYAGSVPMCKEPASAIPDNSYGHYLMQQSLYAFILKTRYDLVLKSSRLVHVPTDESHPVAREVVLTLLSDEAVKALLQHVLS